MGLASRLMLKHNAVPSIKFLNTIRLRVQLTASESEVYVCDSPCLTHTASATTDHGYTPALPLPSGKELSGRESSSLTEAVSEAKKGLFLVRSEKKSLHREKKHSFPHVSSGPPLTPAKSGYSLGPSVTSTSVGLVSRPFGVIPKMPWSCVCSCVTPVVASTCSRLQGTVPITQLSVITLCIRGNTTGRTVWAFPSLYRHDTVAYPEMF